MSTLILNKQNLYPCLTLTCHQNQSTICPCMQYTRRQAWLQSQDASAKTSSGISLNDTLLVSPTVHSDLFDVLLHFRMHCVAQIADISRMCHAVALINKNEDLHHFVQRNSLQDSVRLLHDLCALWSLSLHFEHVCATELSCLCIGVPWQPKQWTKNLCWWRDHRCGLDRESYLSSTWIMASLFSWWFCSL